MSSRERTYRTELLPLWLLCAFFTGLWYTPAIHGEWSLFIPMAALVFQMLASMQYVLVIK